MGKKSTTNIKLAEALKAVFEHDAIVRRKYWDKVNVVSMKDGTLTILSDDGESHPWIISDEDVKADDWEVLMNQSE